MMSSLLPEFSAGWNSRAALAGSHDGHTSAASFNRSQSRLISNGPVMPGLIEVGPDTVIIEAKAAKGTPAVFRSQLLTYMGPIRFSVCEVFG